MLSATRVWWVGVVVVVCGAVVLSVGCLGPPPQGPICPQKPARPISPASLVAALTRSGFREVVSEKRSFRCKAGRVAHVNNVLAPPSNNLVNCIVRRSAPARSLNHVNFQGSSSKGYVAWGTGNVSCYTSPEREPNLRAALERLRVAALDWS